MIAGPPAGGKTLLALDYALRAQLPTLYISADTDSFTMIGRGAARLMATTVGDIENQINAGDTNDIEQVLDEDMDHIRWSFDPSPTLDDIDAEICAFDEMWGMPPELLIIDSLYNVTAESENEWTAMREISKALHHIARTSEAAVIILHHTSEAEGKPSEPAARKAIQGKVAQLPELILTVAMDAFNGLYRVAAVKNRSGPADPTGKTYTTLHVDPSRMLLSDSKSEIANAQMRGQWQ